jgi:hypothetical protein
MLSSYSGSAVARTLTSTSFGSYQKIGPAVIAMIAMAEVARISPCPLCYVHKEARQSDNVLEKVKRGKTKI